MQVYTQLSGVRYQLSVFKCLILLLADGWVMIPLMQGLKHNPEAQVLLPMQHQ